MEDFLTLNEVAALTRLPKSTLQQYRREGRGPLTLKLGKRVLVPRVALEEWIAERAAATSSRQITDRLALRAGRTSAEVLTGPAPADVRRTHTDHDH